MQEVIRKNIYLPGDERGFLASEFLKKISHYQGLFVANLITEFLNEKGITSIDQLNNMSNEEAKLLIKYKNLGAITSNNSSNNANQIAQILINALSQGLNNQPKKEIAKDDSLHSGQEKVSEAISVNETDIDKENRADNTEKKLNIDEPEDTFEDDDFDMGILSSIDAFRQ